MPQYTIKYVAPSLCDEQRTFSIDGTSIYDFLVGDCSTEFGCLFQFDSMTRGIYVYDLYTVCQDCGERGEYDFECPKCGSKNLSYYGQDTTIYVDKNNLTDSIHYEESPDSVKNCFKLEAGDDVITAAVMGLNQNGSDYIYYIRESQMKDMPQELVDKIDEYNVLYDSYTEEYEKLLLESYDLIDEILYYESSMMPTIEQAEVTATTEAEKLTIANLNNLALSSVSENTKAISVDTAIKNYAKVYVKTGYVKLEVMPNSTFTYKGTYEDEDGNTWNRGTWVGQFKVTNYSDEEDIAYSDVLEITVNDNYSEFIHQKIAKEIASSDDESSVFDVLGIEELDDFKEALTHYSLNRLTSFYDAIQGALDVLIGMDQANEEADLYESLYVPYYDKLKACQTEIDIRQATIDEKESELTKNQNRQKEIQKDLDFEENLGDLYPIFCSYRREDKYSNSNYVSDGLSNAEIIEKAKEFLKVAKEELQKSSEKQINISTTLYNLLVMEEFKPIVDYFELGNWIRIRVDGDLYRLRLIGYEINFDSLQTINVTFSTITKVKDFMSDIESVISSAQSMAQSYGSLTKQAEKGSVAQNNIDSWIENGLNSALINISNNNNQTTTMTKRGLLGRAYDDITGTYSDEQSLLTNNLLVFTTNNWESVECALGKHDFTYYDENYDTETTSGFVTETAYGLSAKFVQAGHISGTQIIGGDIYSDNYSSANGTGTHIGLREGTLDLGNSFIWDGSTLKIVGDIIGGSITLGDGTFTVDNDGNMVATSASIIGNISSSTIEGGSIDIGNGTFTVDAEGNMVATSANITGNISSSTIEGGSIDIGNGTFTVDTEGNLSATSASITGTISSSTINGGSINIGNGVFKVDEEGNVTATSANITGSINVSSGSTIAGFSITDKYIQTTDEVMGIGNDTNWAIWAGYNKSDGTAKFKVTQNGDVTANSITITGGSVAGSTVSSGIKGANINNSSISKDKFNSGVATWVGDIAANKIEAVKVEVDELEANVATINRLQIGNYLFHPSYSTELGNFVTWTQLK